MVVSDFYAEPSRALDALDRVRARGHEVIAFHVLDREEKALDLSAGYSKPFIQFLVGPKRYMQVKKKLVIDAGEEITIKTGKPTR